MATIVLDPGHGGEAVVGGSSPNNATGPGGTLEKDLTLKVCQTAQQILQDRGFRVMLTRASDRNLGLKERARHARKNAADAFVSVHFNGWKTPDVQGTETHIHRRASANSRTLATQIQAPLVQATGRRDRGVKDQYAFGVLDPDQHDAVTAACLVEVSFLTDPTEEQRLGTATYLRDIATAIADGATHYIHGRDSTRADASVDAPAVPDPDETSVEDGFALTREAGARDASSREGEQRADNQVLTPLSLTELDLEIENAAASEDLDQLEHLTGYFDASGEPMRAFDHDVVPSPRLVYGADARGGAGMGLANKLSRAIRLTKYRRRRRSGYAGPILVSEGDSWFQYPFILKDVIDNLIDDYAVYSLDAAGDTMEQIMRQAEYEEAIRRENASIFLISAGGNDLVGSGDLDDCLNPYPASGDVQEMLRSERFEVRLAKLRQSYEAMYEGLLRTFPNLHIICHSYDHALPRTKGTWLGPPLTRLGVPLHQQGKVIAALIDRFAFIQRDLSMRHAGRLHFVDCRGVVVGDWHDELHPTDAGYARVAARFKAAVQAAMQPPARGDVIARSEASVQPAIRISRNGRLIGEQGAPLASVLDDVASGRAKTLHLHLHGGLVDQAHGLSIARRLSQDDALGAADRRQVFGVWSSGLLEVLQSNFLEVLERSTVLRLLRHLANWLTPRLRYHGDDLRSGGLTKEEALYQDLARLDAMVTSGAAPVTSLGGELFNRFSGLLDESIPASDFDSLRAGVEADSVLTTVSDAMAYALQTPDQRSALGAGLRDADREAQWLLERLDPEVAEEFRAQLSQADSRSWIGFFAGKAVTIAGAVHRRFSRGRAHGVWPTIVEELARALFAGKFGSAVWEAMKGDAHDAFAGGGDGRALLDQIAAAHQRSGGGFNVAVTAHSAGAIVTCHLLQAAAADPALKDLKWDIVFLAPACDYGLFAETLDRAEGVIGSFRLFALTDEAECQDAVLGGINPRLRPLYPRSLLYLVSGLFEEGEGDESILGMTRFHGVNGRRKCSSTEETAIARVNRFLFDPAEPPRVVMTPTSLDAPLGTKSLANSHLTFDREPETLMSVAEILARLPRKQTSDGRIYPTRLSIREGSRASTERRDPKTEALDRLETVRSMESVFPLEARNQPALDIEFGKVAKGIEAERAQGDGRGIALADAAISRAMKIALPEGEFLGGALNELWANEGMGAQVAAFAKAGISFFRATKSYADRTPDKRLEVGGSGEVTRVLTDGAEILLETQKIVVSFDPDLSDAGRQAVLDANQLVEVKALKGLATPTFQCATAHRSATDVCRDLLVDARIHYAEPDYIRHIGSRADPYEELLAKQWHHGRVDSIGGWHAGYTGSNAVVAVIDNGFDVNHSDLPFDRTQIGPNTDLYNGWYNDKGARDLARFVPGLGGMPDNPHGTACAGMATGLRTANGSGIAFQAKLRAIACLNDQVGSQVTLARALLFAADPSNEINGLDEPPPGADVIVCSLGPSATGRWAASSVLKDALEFVATSSRNGRGIPIFWAVTNGNHPIRYDEVCSSPHVIAVGRSTAEDGDFGSGFGPELDFLATGVRVSIPNSGGGYKVTTGTSFAAPCAAGVAALLSHVAPNLTAAQVRSVLRDTCDKVGDYPYYNKRNDYFGFGRINAKRAIIQAKSI